MRFSPLRIRAFREKIFSWWEWNKRDLPWRKTRDPYRVWISEVMLQQTQVDRVVPKYEAFLYFFPDVWTLSQAPLSKVIRAWHGLGYNRRALHIRNAARVIVRDYRGDLPADEQLLMILPGVGRYTARAILVFAHGVRTSLVDTNIRSIITHFFFRDVPQKPAVIEKTAEMLLPDEKVWEWHQALMDYGALEMKKTRLRRQVKGKRKTKERQVPFRESNRFFRGRIIDRLRDRSAQESALIGDLISRYGKTDGYYRTLLRDLAKEGLIAKSSRGIVSLPE
jgi:A/G-specific adenine glycosylase